MNIQGRAKAIHYVEEHFNPRLKFSEVKRQIFHLIYGLLIILATLLFSRYIIGGFLTLLVFVGGILTLLHKKNKIGIIDLVLQHVERPRDMDIFPAKGAFFYTFGCAITLLIFPEGIALAAIAILAIGDSLSHLTGLIIRKKRHNNPDVKKLVEGTLVGILLSSLATAFFVDPLFGCIAASIAMTVEFLENLLARVDDNFYIPLISAIVLFVLQSLFG
jgi:dolichol kinase